MRTRIIVCLLESSSCFQHHLDKKIMKKKLKSTMWMPGLFFFHRWNVYNDHYRPNSSVSDWQILHCIGIWEYCTFSEEGSFSALMFKADVMFIYLQWFEYIKRELRDLSSLKFIPTAFDCFCALDWSRMSHSPRALQLHPLYKACRDTR